MQTRPIRPDLSGTTLRRLPIGDDGSLEVMVTHLEMSRPDDSALPARPPAPAGPRLALLRAERPTLAFYRFLYDSVGGSWLWWERRVMDDDTLAGVLADEAVEVYVLYADGVPAGFAEIDRRDAPVVDLAYFGLMPEFTGQRLGPFLLGAAIDIAWNGPGGAPGDGSVEKLTVNTCNLDHPKALPLYQRFGFRPVRQETKRVRDPRAEGVI